MKDQEIKKLTREKLKMNKRSIKSAKQKIFCESQHQSLQVVYQISSHASS